MSARGRINVLIEPSDYQLRNAGDTAMLRVAIERVVKRLPCAEVTVLTNDADTLRLLNGDAKPLASHGRDIWTNPQYLPGAASRWLGSRALASLRRSHPRWVLASLRARLRYRGRQADLNALDAYVGKVRSSHLVLVAGMGGIADAFPEYASDLLNSLALAIYAQRYVVMTGQGFGPLLQEDLRTLARSVLPGIARLYLREGVRGPGLLQSLGVSDDRVVVTGDDAIELAFDPQWSARPIGTAIGVNVRISDYSNVTESQLAELKLSLRKASQTIGCRLSPIPISNYPQENDLAVANALTGRDLNEQGGFRPNDTEDVLRRIRLCRVVVTGSYHAGVFALANGIPVIGLVGSTYYMDKFEGLSDLFGPGCVSLPVASELGVIEDAVYKLWASAPALRSGLIRNAERQIELGNAAYDLFCREVGDLAGLTRERR